MVASLMAITGQEPELRVLAQMAGIDPDKLALAFTQPEIMFDHISLDELGRLQVCCNRLAAMQTEMVMALNAYAVKAREILGV